MCAQIGQAEVRSNSTPLHACREHGWGSAAWNDSVSDVDGYLGDLLDLIENDALLNGSTTVILSSDHGCGD